MQQELHPDDEPLNCSVSEVESLELNAAWREIVSTLEQAKEDWMARLQSAGDMKEVAKAQATLQAIDYMLSLPDEFKQELKQVDTYEREQ